MPRQPALAVVPLLVIAATLVGCAEPTRLPPPEPSAAEAPLFSSDEEALAAATAAYEEYLAVSNAILRDGGGDPDRLRPLVSDTVFRSEREGYEQLSTRGWRTTGEIELLSVSLQQYFANSDDSVQVVAYVCTSVESNDVIDRNGVSQVDPNRALIIAHEVVFTFATLNSRVLEEKQQWATDGTCL